MRNTLQYLLLLCFVLGACGEPQAVKDRKARHEQQVKDSLALKVAVMPTLDCLPFFVAKERGIFDSLHLDVRLRLYRAQMDCDTALVGGSVQGAVTDLVRAERLQHRGLPLNYKIATAAYWQLVANRKKRITQLSDLADKMIAMTRYSVTDMIATEAMEKGKLKNPAFKVQVNDVTVRLGMLMNNEMDAMVLTEPQATAARLFKHPVLLSTADNDFRPGVVAFRRADMADEHRSRQVQLLLRAYDAACDSISRYGTLHYAAELEKYCRADLRTVKALPKTMFTHAAAPRQKDVDTARRWIAK